MTAKAALDKLAETKLESSHLSPEVPLDNQALIVRRYAPVLSQMDARLLQLCCESWTIQGLWGPRAKKLVKAGLLSREGDTFKVTEAGATIIERFYHLGWLERPKGTKP